MPSEVPPYPYAGASDHVRQGWREGYAAAQEAQELRTITADEYDRLNGAADLLPRYQAALQDIAEMPLDGDYDYSPGVSERLRALDALR